MGKYKKHPLDRAFAERLTDACWCDNISARVTAERGRVSKLRMRIGAVAVFFVASTAIISADIWQEDAAEDRLYAMMDEASGDLTSQSLTRLTEWFE